MRPHSVTVLIVTATVVDNWWLVLQSVMSFSVGSEKSTTEGGTDEDTSGSSTRIQNSRPKAPPSSEGGVLVVAEKPSVAKALAQHLSNGRMRTASNTDGLAPMCKLH